MFRHHEKGQIKGTREGQVKCFFLLRHNWCCNLNAEFNAFSNIYITPVNWEWTHAHAHRNVWLCTVFNKFSIQFNNNQPYCLVEAQAFWRIDLILYFERWNFFDAIKLKFNCSFLIVITELILYQKILISLNDFKLLDDRLNKLFRLNVTNAGLNLCVSRYRIWWNQVCASIISIFSNTNSRQTIFSPLGKRRHLVVLDTGTTPPIYSDKKRICCDVWMC